ncbi:uncharacterized protein J3D65DRAFT_162259 [Phyllosticta citribraziliensis]|uniref:Uncharacterized protein n=1 Tax=Phyllosticta citribraziliensis TaxID=989973 RepID=A0ABR1L5L9_9PEZI
MTLYKHGRGPSSTLHAIQIRDGQGCPLSIRPITLSAQLVSITIFGLWSDDAKGSVFRSPFDCHACHFAEHQQGTDVSRKLQRFDKLLEDAIERNGCCQPPAHREQINQSRALLTDPQRLVVSNPPPTQIDVACSKKVSLAPSKTADYGQDHNVTIAELCQERSETDARECTGPAVPSWFLATSEGWPRGRTFLPLGRKEGVGTAGDDGQGGKGAAGNGSVGHGCGGSAGV